MCLSDKKPIAGRCLNVFEDFLRPGGKELSMRFLTISSSIFLVSSESIWSGNYLRKSRYCVCIGGAFWPASSITDFPSRKIFEVLRESCIPRSFMLKGAASSIFEAFLLIGLLIWVASKKLEFEPYFLGTLSWLELNLVLLKATYWLYDLLICYNDCGTKLSFSILSFSFNILSVLYSSLFYDF